MVRIGEPNGNCLHEKGPYKGHIGDKYGFLLLTPVGTIKGLKMLTLAKARMTESLTWVLNLKRRSKVESQYTGSSFQE